MPTQIGSIAGNTAVGFITQLVNAKENGEKLPMFFDKLATLAIQGKGKAKDLALEQAKEQSKKQLSWILVGVLSIVLIIVIVKMRK